MGVQSDLAIIAAIGFVLQWGYTRFFQISIAKVSTYSAADTQL
jgi:hypothetical protein